MFLFFLILVVSHTCLATSSVEYADNQQNLDGEFYDLSLMFHSHTTQSTDDRYVLTFFGARRVPHGHYHHHNHDQLRATDPVTTISPQDIVTGAPNQSANQIRPPSPPIGLRRAVLGKFTFSLILRNGSRIESIGGSQRIEPLGRLSEYAVSLAGNSLDDAAAVVIRFSTNSTRKLVKMSKIWITKLGPILKKAQFNVPEDATNDILGPDTEFTMLRGCKHLNKEADRLLIQLYAGTGYLCEDVTIDPVIHEDEQVDWQTLVSSHTQ